MKGILASPYSGPSPSGGDARNQFGLDLRREEKNRTGREGTTEGSSRVMGEAKQ